MRDQSVDLCRVGRPGRDRRVLKRYKSQLSELLGADGEAVPEPHHGKAKARSVRTADQRVNWRIKRLGRDVVAIEPDGVYENPFDGPTAFWDAVEFAAAEMRKTDAS